MVSRLQTKTLQIGQMLNNLQKYNHLLNDDHMANRTAEIPPFVRTSKNTIMNKPNTLAFKEIAKPAGTTPKKEETSRTPRTPTFSQNKPVEVEKQPQWKDDKKNQCYLEETSKPDVVPEKSIEKEQQQPNEEVVTKTSQPVDPNKTES